MIRLVNKTTGGEMWVHESRLDEYLAAGHKFAAPPPIMPPAASAPEKEPETVSPSDTPKRTTSKAR